MCHLRFPAQWDVVNAFSQEAGFKAAMAGIVLCERDTTPPNKPTSADEDGEGSIRERCTFCLRPAPKSWAKTVGSLTCFPTLRPVVGCVYVSIFTSGGMDGSRRYIPEQADMYQSCDLESDPSCRYN
jgi:hypothetical protein